MEGQENKIELSFSNERAVIIIQAGSVDKVKEE
jgi:hypothetical protein